jgi:gas vesicle protein
MRKVCPICRREQQDEKIIVCEICKEPFISLESGLRLLTKEQITELASAILRDSRVRFITRWVFPLLTLCGVCLAVLFLNSQASKRLRAATDTIERTTTNEIAKAYTNAMNQLAAQFQMFAKDASNQVSSAYSSVTNQIAAEFQTPRIKQTVEAVAKNQAKEILETHVQPEVDRFRSDADFLRIATRAHAYDFKAYQQLLTLKAQTNENAYFAKQVVAEIDRSLEKDRGLSQLQPRRFAETSIGYSFAGPFSPDELATRFSAIEHDPTPQNREGFINTIDELNQPLFLPRLFSFFTNEHDLLVADRVSLAISHLSNQDFHPRDLERMRQWWESHHIEYTNWPVSELGYAMEEFGMSHYREAADAVARVLQVDSAADMSRAFAIVCNWELGETNKARALANGFKVADGRWAKWAAVKAELCSGNISNAIVRLAFIATNFPTFFYPPSRAWPALRAIDWELFDRLTNSVKP